MTLLPLLLAPALMIGIALGGYAIFAVTDPKKKLPTKKPVTTAVRFDHTT